MLLFHNLVLTISQSGTDLHVLRYRCIKSSIYFYPLIFFEERIVQKNSNYVIKMQNDDRTTFNYLPETGKDGRISLNHLIEAGRDGEETFYYLVEIKDRINSSFNYLMAIVRHE